MRRHDTISSEIPAPPIPRVLDPAPRTILTPGPVEAEPRVLRAMSSTILGQFDPDFTAYMNDTMALLRYVFQTRNEWSLPIDGTSRAGLEAVLVSAIRPGDKVLVPIYGRFGHLLVEIAERCGADVETMEMEWGAVFDPQDIIRAIKEIAPAIVAIVHGETSTGRMQPLDGIGAACREVDALLVVDAVATIGGTPVRTDEWMMDAVVGGTQKCLSIPSGMAPLTYNDRFAGHIAHRKRVERGIRVRGAQVAELQDAIRSNYLDLCQLQDYWSPVRLNHHTEATAMVYALHEGLRIVVEEGLEQRFRRHRLHEQALVSGLQAMGLTLFGDPYSKMPMVTCVNIPDSVDGDSVRAMLLHHFGIEIASSFGPLRGRIWRIGTMGYSCSKRNVLLFLGAFSTVLRLHGVKLSQEDAAAAALDRYKALESVAHAGTDAGGAWR